MEYDENHLETVKSTIQGLRAAPDPAHDRFGFNKTRVFQKTKNAELATKFEGFLRFVEGVDLRCPYLTRFEAVFVSVFNDL